MSIKHEIRYSTSYQIYYDFGRDMVSSRDKAREYHTAGFEYGTTPVLLGCSRVLEGRALNFKRYLLIRGGFGLTSPL